MKPIRTLLAALSSMLLVMAAVPSQAQTQAPTTYPSRPVRLVVPFPPGGPTDVLSRLLGQKLGEMWQQQVVIENRPGGQTVIGADAVAKAPGDGYTLLMAIDSTLVMNPYLFDKLPYDPLNDFVPVGLAVTLPLIMVVNSESPLRSVADVIARAKKAGPPPTFGSGTVTAQLAGETFKSRTGSTMTYVPYKGSAPTTQAGLTGEVDVIFEGITSPLQHIKAGKLRALAVTTDQRFPSLPDVPTIAESGVPGFNVGVWLGLVAPRGTPPAIVAKINADAGKVLSDPEVRDRLLSLGMSASPGSSESFAQLIRSDHERWAKPIKALGITLN